MRDRRFEVRRRGRVRTLEAAELIGQEPAAMHEQKPQMRKAFEYAAKDERGRGRRRRRRVAVGDVHEEAFVVRQPADVNRMNDDRHVESARRLPERIESRIVERLPLDAGADLHGFHTELRNGVVQFFRGRARLLQRYRRGAKKTGGMLRDDCGERFVLRARKPPRIGGREIVGRKIHPAREQLRADAARIHPLQACPNVGERRRYG